MKPSEIRVLRGSMTRIDFASALDPSGALSHRNIENWEQGRSKPDKWGQYLLSKYIESIE